MSRSIRGRGSANGASVLVECDPAEVDATARVMDVDQLSPADQEEFFEAVGGSTRSHDVADLVAGDVVRYTEYYCVDR